jgi:hypothetical protein
MAVFRIFPSKDTWITNRTIDNDISTLATGSNHGRSPALNVFAFLPDITSSSIDLGRILTQFDLTNLSGKIYEEGIIPSSSVSYVLKMFDMRHTNTVPTSYDLFAFPLSRSWDEGVGIDDDRDTDGGVANWLQPVSTADWVTTGSDFLTTEYGSGSQHFDEGNEDLEMDITDIVVNWLTGSISNNGLALKLGDTEENSGGFFFRKVFHGRESLFVENLPYLEARWDSVIKDNRENVAYDQSNTLYMYNVVRGELANLTEPITVRLQDHVVGNSASYSGEFAATRVSTGIYSVTFNIENTASFSASWSDIWFSGSRAHMTGTFRPLVLTGSQVDQYDEFDIDVTNLKRVYGVDEEARVKVNVRKRDYVTHLGVLPSASLDMEREYIEKMYFGVMNNETGDMIVPFGTGSLSHTQLSYDGDGNYFNLWMNSFVPGFTYRLLFLIDINRFDKKLVDDGFVFKVV